MPAPEKASETSVKDGFNLDLFFELSPDLLCIAGFDGYFKRINQTVANTLGYTKEELMSRPIDSFVHPEDVDKTSKSRANVIGNSPLINFDNRYLTKSGDIVWLSWTSMAIESESVVFGIAKNITHKRKVEEDRNSMLANLTRLNNDLKQLTFTTSHDLRSPVNNLLSVFSFIDLSKISDQETLQLIEMLKTAAGSLKDTLDNYVDALSQKDVLNVQIEEVKLNDVFEKVTSSLSSLITNSKAQVRRDLSEPAAIRFNRTYLESIFLNLISNSIKYAKPDSRPEIFIYSRKENGISQLVFEDQGIGFDMDKVKDKIFGFNQRFHEHADSKGIGLYLVYNHITSLGGRISIESSVNKGARFIISFKG